MASIWDRIGSKVGDGDTDATRGLPGHAFPAILGLVVDGDETAATARALLENNGYSFDANELSQLSALIAAVVAGNPTFEKVERMISIRELGWISKATMLARLGITE
jgi:hypothetical protein